MKRIKLTLQNPNDNNDFLDLEFIVKNTNLGNQWFNKCIEDVKSEKRLEKNYCWLGWPDETRTVEFLSYKLQNCVDTINNFADNNIELWEGYRIDETWNDISSDDALNLLHHHFEMLMGQVWNVAKYMKTANPETCYAIRQLNNLVHELASRKTASGAGMTIVSYLCPDRELFDNEHYESFSLKRNFGDIFLHYAQTGKTPIEAFEDDDDYVFNNNINALRYISGEFNIWWSSSVSDSEVVSTKSHLREWLSARDVIMKEQEDFCYYVDPEGNKQGIGWLTVASIINPFETEKQLVEEINKRLNIYRLSCYDGDEQLAEVIWPYKWTDENYIKEEIEYLTPLFPTE